MSKEGGSWVGNLYQKFEAVCQEVDDIVNHDHIKIFENHVHLVGDNVAKFCSNVKGLIPSSFGAPVKHVEQSVNSDNLELKDGDGECPSIPSVPDSSKSSPTDIQVSDDLHFENNLENPSSKDTSSLSSEVQSGQSDSFSIKQDYDSEISDAIFFDSHTNQDFDSFTEEEQAPCDASELTCHECSSINENSDSFTKEVEKSLSNMPELTFPDEDSCEISTSSMLVPFDVSSSACKHSPGSDFHKKEETVHDTIDEHSSEHDFLCKDETVNDDIHESSPGYEFDVKEETIHEFSLGSHVCVKDEKVLDKIHKHSQVAENQVEEDIVIDYFDVSTENAPNSLLNASATSSHNETPSVILTSSINFPLLHFSDHGETESRCTEGNSFIDFVSEIGSASTSTPAFQSSEPYSCFFSLKENTGGGHDSSVSPFSSSMEFTEVPINPPTDSEGLKLKNMELPGKSDLDASCVFVTDRNHTLPSAVERHWLRKKKMSNPFSSRKKLEKEYKRLSLLHYDFDAEFNEVAGENLVRLSHNKQPSAQDLQQDSEWEFL